MFDGLLDAGDARVIKTTTSSDPLTSVDLLSDGSTLVVGTSHGHVSVYDLRKPSYSIRSQFTHQSAISRVCFSSHSPNNPKVSQYIIYGPLLL